MTIAMVLEGDEDKFRGMQREISATMTGPNLLSMCTSGTHCIAGCDCIDRACVNMDEFNSKMKSCQRCNSTSGNVCKDNGKCMPSIGFCDVCSSAAVKAGLDACISEVDRPVKGTDGNADVIIAIPIGTETAIEVPAGTDEPAFALPPGASVKPEDGKGDSNRDMRSLGDGNDSDTDPTASQTAIPDLVDGGSFEDGMVLLPSVEAEEADCVSISWLKLHGHMNGLLHYNNNNNFHMANVLCLPLEYNLPCGTRGHLLLREDGTMETYEAICKQKACVGTRMLVGRLRAAYEWSKVASKGLELTPFSVGDTRISKFIARAAASIASVGLGCAEILDEISRGIVRLRQLDRILRPRCTSTAAVMGITTRT